MSAGSRIWRGTLFVSGAGILARIGVFLGNIAVLRILGKEQVGVLGLVEAWLTVATMFSLVGIGIAATKFVAQYLEEDPSRLGGLIGTALLIGSLSSIIVGAIFYLGVMLLPTLMGTIIGGVTQQTLAQYAPLVFCLVVVITLQQIAGGVLYGLQSFHVFIISNSIIGLLGFPIYFLLTQWQGVAGALEARLALALIEALFLLYFVFAAMRQHGVGISFGSIMKDGRQLLSLGFPAFVGQLVVNPVQAFVISLLAAQPGGLRQVGAFTTATRLCAFAAFIPGSMTPAIVPILSSEWSRNDPARFRESVLLALRTFWLVTLPIVLVFMAASPTLLGWLYGGEYADAWVLVTFLLVINLLTSLNETGDRALLATGRIWLSTANSLAWTGLFLLLTLWLVPWAQALGYVIAFVLSFTLYVTLQLWWLKHLFGVAVGRLAHLFLISILFLLLAAVVASGAVSSTGLAQLIIALALGVSTTLIEWRFFVGASEKSAILRRISGLRARGAELAGRLAQALRS
jgi:stage V sporulation protein B